MKPWTLHHGDCREVMATLDECSVDAVVTDPPYALTANKRGGSGAASVNLGSPYGRARIGTGNGAGGFMGKAWDANLPGVETWIECLRVLKPGGHLLAFGGTRTYHRLACAIEDAGFEIRDCIAWMYGSGFPKSKNVALSIDKANGSPNRGRAIPKASRFQNASDTILSSNRVSEYEAKSAEAIRWQGWGTALKPAYEPVVVARKPLSERNVAANVLRWGTGAVNVDGCRIRFASEDDKAAAAAASQRAGRDQNAWRTAYGKFTNGEASIAPYLEGIDRGRWPANVALDEEAAQGMGEPSRYFYTAKASRSEREIGLDGMLMRRGGSLNATVHGDSRTGHVVDGSNHHPTVKPVDLMRWLVRLVTPPGGVVLDPFAGSGSTLIAALREGFSCIGIEREAEYVEIARRRIVGDAPLLNGMAL